MSSLTINGAYEDDELIGVIATRNEGNHIALFFVKAEWQGIRFTPMSICLTGLSNMKTLQESEIL